MQTRFIILLLTLVITACGPRLEQVKNYVPPIGENGLACIQMAQTDRQSCNDNNTYLVRACNDKAERESYDALQTRERQYTAELEQFIDLQKDFNNARAAYNEQRRLIMRDGELAYIRCSNDINLAQLEQFPQCKRFFDEAEKKADRLLVPREPLSPVKPNHADILRELSRNCSSQTTDCNQNFDDAYISCGGQINFSTICVDNC